ncbi:putative sodium bile acid cotransporter [Macleaya cordata]|uniref:Putative sodium bile acid cotransporter n=1 Tax=Macleaya cordata TaxID=56857 RepID=A0A200QN14_MACCD|nr:putative sodium bile acid cotransporter [Macleaya cordata]
MENQKFKDDLEMDSGVRILPLVRILLLAESGCGPGKTLPVMVAVVEQLRGALGESGLLVLPCVAAHINQIIIDSFLVNYWLRKDQASNNFKEA